MRLRFARVFVQRMMIAAFALVPALARVARAQELDCDPLNNREVRSLSFVGNTTFTDDDLSARVATTPSSFTHRYFGWFFNAGIKRCIPDGGLAPDVAALTQFYRNNGFYDTKVDTIVTGSPTAVRVAFQISEGLPIRIDSLTIGGLDDVADTSRILRGLRLRVGGRFGMDLLISDVDSITRRLGNAGYPTAQVLRSFTVNRQQHRATIDLGVSTGDLAHFGSITVKSTSVRNTASEIDSTVVRRLLGFRSGDQYADRSLTDAQRNLYNLGAYQHVGVFIDTLAQHGDSVADVIVELHEDYLKEVQLEEGWAILDCFRVNALYNDKNFLDNAQRLDLTGRLSKIGYGAPTDYSGLRNICYRPYLDKDSIASSKVNYYAGATLRRPTLFGTHWIPSYSAYTERRGEYEAFLRTTYLGFEAAATRSLGLGIPFRAGYTIEYGQTVAQPAVLCAIFTTCDQAAQIDAQRPLRLAIASATIQRIRTDNSIEPTHGSVIGGEIRAGAPFIGADPSLKFLKTTADVSWYHQLNSRTVFAFRVRGGLISGSGSKLPPPQERLYAGGASSVRGFQQNELGPVAYLLDSASFTIDSLPDGVAYVAKPGVGARRTIPLGGNTQFVVNAELRLRDPFFPDVLEYVPFIDGGQVWTQHVGSRGLNVERPEVTPGLGIRVFSPVGPIQLNAGYNPHQSRGGPAYYASPVDPNSSRAPLICVTAPGVTPVPVRVVGGEIQQDVGACPLFVPSRSSNFLKHFIFTLSIGTGF